VNLYDVLADGYHTPLTKIQIIELFQAGRLGRNQPCKQTEKKEWRTVDELFPLLKYDSSRQSFYQSPERHSLNARNLVLAIAISALAISVVFALYLALRGEGHAIKDAAMAEVRAKPPERVATSFPVVNGRSVDTSANLAQSEDFSRQARLAQERLAAAQRQREQAEAAQLRLAQDRANAEQRERELQKAAGRTQRIPLDQFATIHNVGGSDVTVKIHDHDITDIDVWTPSGGPFRMTKQKGISNSRTDETLIYRNARAALYYVWEISGRLDHCLLRVRDD
jgi:hypothetical protein